jgi:hypothetical protein
MHALSLDENGSTGIFGMGISIDHREGVRIGPPFAIEHRFVLIGLQGSAGQAVLLFTSPLAPPAPDAHGGVHQYPVPIRMPRKVLVRTGLPGRPEQCEAAYSGHVFQKTSPFDRHGPFLLDCRFRISRPQSKIRISESGIGHRFPLFKNRQKEMNSTKKTTAIRYS